MKHQIDTSIREEAAAGLPNALPSTMRMGIICKPTSDSLEPESVPLKQERQGPAARLRRSNSVDLTRRKAFDPTPIGTPLPKPEQTPGTAIVATVEAGTQTKQRDMGDTAAVLRAVEAEGELAELRDQLQVSALEYLRSGAQSAVSFRLIVTL